MNAVRTHPRHAGAAGGACRRATRHAAVAALLSILALLLLAAVAQAVVPGKLLFAKRIGTSTSPAGGWSMAAAPNGGVVLAGWQDVASVETAMVARYTSGGAQSWLKTYPDMGRSHVDQVACDRGGNVYLAATLLSDDHDIAVVKYNAGGLWQWTRTYDGGVNGYDHAEDIAVDGAGNVVVVGQSAVNGQMGVVVLKYTPSGDPAWAAPARWDPAAADPDAGPYYVDVLALDGAGNVYVAGSRYYSGIENAVVFKAAGADGTEQPGWVYEPRHGDSSYFEGLTVRGTSVAAVGSVWSSASDGDENALAVKLDLGLTREYWKEWGVGNKTQEWFGDAVLDPKGNLFVTGDQWNEVKGGFDRSATLKLNARLSKVLWTRTYTPRSRDAEGWYIARDALGNVYVSGVKDVAAGHTDYVDITWDYLTIKYSPAGAQKWLRTWSGGGPDSDEPDSVLVSSKGGVYVGGDASARGDFAQAALLKYKQ
jgi:hypothetical protein